MRNFLNQGLFHCLHHQPWLCNDTAFKEHYMDIAIILRHPSLSISGENVATAWLNEFYKSGKDPTAYLSILATYLGHTHVSNTQTYLHASIELLQTAGRKFNDHIHKLPTQRNLL